MAMLKDEVQMLKATPIRVDDSHIMLVTLQYHTEKTDDNRRAKGKSFYRWFAKTMSDKDWEARIDYLMDDVRRLEKYKIPNDPSGLYLCCKNGVTNYETGDWLGMKINKAMSWEDGMQHLKGFKKAAAKRAEGINPNAVYDTNGYVAENGDIVDLTDKEDVLKHVNQNLIKPAGMGKKDKKIA